GGAPRVFCALGSYMGATTPVIKVGVRASRCTVAGKCSDAKRIGEDLGAFCPGAAFVGRISIRPWPSRVGMNSDLRGPTCRLRLVAREPFATIACFLDEATPDVIGIPCARAFDSFHFNGRFGRLVDFVGVRC